MTAGTADDRMGACDEFAPVEGLGQIVVGADAEAADLAVRFGEPREDEDGCVDARRTQPAQNLEAVDVREHQVEADKIVFVQLADLEAVHIGRAALSERWCKDGAYWVVALA